MHEDTAGDTVAVYSRERLPASLSILDYPPHQEYIEQDDEGTSDKSPFFTDGAEDEVRALFRDESLCGLSTIEISFACQSARSDGNHGLVHVVSYSRRVFLHSEKHLDTLSLVVLKHVVEKEVDGEYESYAGERGYYRKVGEGIPFSERLICYKR